MILSGAGGSLMRAQSSDSRKYLRYFDCAAGAQTKNYRYSSTTWQKSRTNRTVRALYVAVAFDGHDYGRRQLPTPVALRRDQLHMRSVGGHPVGGSLGKPTQITPPSCPPNTKQQHKHSQSIKKKRIDRVLLFM